IDVWRQGEFDGVVEPFELRDVDAAIARLVARGDGHNFQLAWETQFRLTLNELQQAAAHRAEASDAKPQRFARRRHPTAFLAGAASGFAFGSFSGFVFTPFASMNLRTLRAAWRIRCSFSTRASRT